MSKLQKIPQIKKHVGVNLDIDIWRAVKVAAARNDMTMTDWVTAALISCVDLDYTHTDNAEHEQKRARPRLSVEE